MTFSTFEQKNKAFKGYLTIKEKTILSAKKKKEIVNHLTNFSKFDR